MEKPTNKERYFDGTKNTIIRMYFYVLKGMDILNQFRNLFFLIFGVYVAFKLSNIIWLVLMFCISIPLLLFAGYVSVHHIGKVVDWLSVRFATHYTNYTYELMELQISKLEEIIKELKND